MTKQEPPKQETFEWIRGKMLGLSADDKVNDYLEVTFDSDANSMTEVSLSGTCVNFLNTLDTSSAAWDVFDNHKPDKLLRLTLIASSGKVARRCTKPDGSADAKTPANKVRLVFSISKASDITDFQDKMAKAFKHLIVLCGGVREDGAF